MENYYVCAFCGRKHVKLWRPYGSAEPLICASCAEERQIPSGKNINKWMVDENGQIPVQGGKTSIKTNQLKNVLDIKTLVPAVTDGSVGYWSCETVPAESMALWQKLPTR